jgi:hypothetical protein
MISKLIAGRRQAGERDDICRAVHEITPPNRVGLCGYAPQPLVGPFDIENLVADVVALIDDLGVRQVDWSVTTGVRRSHAWPAP